MKPGYEGKVVLDEMITWFNDSTMEVVARKYALSYSAMVYKFKVNMEVQMTTFNGLTVPSLIRYVGDWKAITKKGKEACLLLLYLISKIKGNFIFLIYCIAAIFQLAFPYRLVIHW